MEKIGLEYIDLMLIHRPPLWGTGENLWESLIRAKKDGLTHDIGVSNYSINLIDKLIDASGEVPAVNQIEWSPFGYSEAMKKYCDKKKIVIQAYSPLTRGARLDDPTLNKLADKIWQKPCSNFDSLEFTAWHCSHPQSQSKRAFRGKH